jgi:hypothetical protein
MLLFLITSWDPAKPPHAQHCWDGQLWDGQLQAVRQEVQGPIEQRKGTDSFGVHVTRGGTWRVLNTVSLDGLTDFFRESLS